ncbi:hypothetical protein Tco_0521380, partial [Tanacetum coccineum]
ICGGGGITDVVTWVMMLMAWRWCSAGVGGVVKAAVMEAAMEVASGCGSGGWRQICGWWNGGV